MWEDNKPEYLQYIIYNHQVSKKKNKVGTETRKSDLYTAGKRKT